MARFECRLLKLEGAHKTPAPYALHLPPGGRRLPMLVLRSASEQTELAAVAAGELAPGQGAALLGAIGTLARMAEVDELARRIEALEGKHATD